jgi:tetratricopeptide (TPR) repeat protein
MADAETAALVQEAVALCEGGRFVEAVDLVQRALAVDPGNARANKLLAMALHRIGRHDEALAAFDRAIAQQPDFADAHGGRGDVLLDLGRHAEAVASYDQALALVPDSAADWCNRGAALQALERYDSAVASFDRAIAVAPRFAEAHYNRGGALARLKRHEEALAAYDRALEITPDYADALNNRANALKELGRISEALDSVERALAIQPDHGAALVTRAAVLGALGRHAEALASCDTALAGNSQNFDALVKRGNALIELERFEEAIATLDQALAIDPGYNEAKWNKSLLCLHLGRFGEGWPLYEHRWTQAKGMLNRHYPQHRWGGGRVDGPLLIWGEQGLGDHMIHAGMVEETAARAQSVVLEVEPRLVTLFQRSFPGVQVIGLNADLRHYTGPVAAQEPLASIGAYFRNSWDDFPRRERGYLMADPVRTQSLRARLGGERQTVIGLSWRSVSPTTGKSKSAQLRDLTALLEMPGCQFVDLQYGDTLAERQSVEQELGIAIARLPDIDNTNDIDGLASLISACDLVVTVSNTTAHLAGALGASTWVMVPFGHARMWYWFRDRDESPWYPRVNVRRQRAGQPWPELVASVTDEVARFRAKPEHGPD